MDTREAGATTAGTGTADGSRGRLEFYLPFPTGSRVGSGGVSLLSCMFYCKPTSIGLPGSTMGVRRIKKYAAHSCHSGFSGLDRGLEHLRCRPILLLSPPSTTPLPLPALYDSEKSLLPSPSMVALRQRISAKTGGQRKLALRCGRHGAMGLLLCSRWLSL